MEDTDPWETRGGSGSGGDGPVEDPDPWKIWTRGGSGPVEDPDPWRIRTSQGLKVSQAQEASFGDKCIKSMPQTEPHK